MADAPSSNDAYSQAKTNIRDTVKWLANTFAALAAVVVAGSSFSGIGKLPPGSTRLYISVLAVVLAFTCICSALYITLQLLRSDALYPSDLDPRKSLNELANADEIRPIREEIEKHRIDLFPPDFPSMQRLLERIETLQKMRKNPHPMKNLMMQWMKSISS